MNRVRSFFVEEATDCLDVLETALMEDRPDPDELYGAVRRFRGSAQVARFGALADEAWSLELALKAVARGREPWTRGVQGSVVESLAALARGVDAVRDGRMEQDEREPEMDEQVQNEQATEKVVPIESLEYQGQDALRQAQALREPLEDAIYAGDPPGAIIDELFDLIQLGTK